ncbi:MAG TPA: IS630 family transposase [Streptosporangiaceae bacterium]|nr:IS630 family transposase [Streptosporangiaceae bacterium]
MTGPRAVPVRMTVKRERKLRQVIAAGTSPQRLVRRARIILAAADGDPNAKIARDLGCSVNTVREWRARFARLGIPGIFDRPRPGRQEAHGPSVRLLIIATATSAPPDGESCWSQDSIARHLRERGLAVSRATVGRALAEARVRPHKVRGWLNRKDDPAFWAQAGAVCRLYLDPPPGTVLVSIDEKTGIQAKSRRYPDAPARPGRDARREWEYRRHGTVSIIAAMNTATGEVISQRIRRNDSAAFTEFLSMLDQHTAPGLRIHLIMDNGSSHTSKATRAWIAAHPRFTVTHTPKHASWLNVIEQWFSILTRKLLRRGSFESQEDLDRQVTEFTTGYNKTAHPWKWKYDADAEHARYLARHPGKSALAKAA